MKISDIIDIICQLYTLAAFIVTWRSIADEREYIYHLERRVEELERRG